MVKEYTLFVYGQLMSGRRLHSVMQDALFLGTATIPKYRVDSYEDTYFKLSVDTENTAKGELYLINEKLKFQLDAVEYGYNFIEIVPNIFAYMEK
jgi:gamma-glutamylcyclotransferase (GGCT)/AIG2-like uncharacterized protein YtfP